MLNGKDILCGSLDESELETLVFEGKDVFTTSHGSGDWQEYMTTVIEYGDDTFYSIDWRRGLTENQDNSFWDQPTRVYKVPYVEADHGVRYVEDKDANLSVTVTKEDIEGAKLIVDGAEEAVESLKNFDIDSVLDFLNSAEAVLLNRRHTSFVLASKDLFKTLKDVQKELS